MPAFQMLSYDLLAKNTEQLLEKVFEKHARNQTELKGPRSAQVELLASVIDRLKFMAHQTAPEVHRAQMPAEIKKVVTKIVKISEQIRDLKKVTDLSDAQKELLARLEKEKLKFETEKKGLMRFRNKSKTDEVSVEQSDKLISDEQRALIITGALLDVKKKIEFEYSGRINQLLAFVRENSPTNSELYKGLDATIGITAENQMDVETEKKALAAYRQYVSIIEDVKHYDRSKMKKVKTVEKDHLYIYDVSAHLAENGHADELLDSQEQKQRYKRFIESQDALNSFIDTVKPAVETFDPSRLNNVETVEKSGQANLVSGPDFAKLPNGLKAKNKVIHDNTDATVYMNGVTLPADKDGRVVQLDEKQQKAAYAQTSKFFGGVQAQLEGRVKLNHKEPTSKPVDENTVQFQKRF